MGKIEEIGTMSILFDFYGQLLPEKQQEIFRLYHEDNYSLAEIGQELGITRQGVHESVKKAERRLQAYESNLGLAGRFRKMEEALEQAGESIGQLMTEHAGDPVLEKKLTHIREEIQKAGRGLEI